MVCADDTLTNLDAGWVDVAAEISNEEANNKMLPLTDTETMKTFLREEEQVNESVAESDEQEATNENEESTADVYSQVVKGARKAGVAAAGGTLVAVGALLTPLPTPGGILLAGAGLGVLSTEFECAKKALDAGKQKLVGLIDSIPEEENGAEEEISRKDSEDTEDTASVVSEKSSSAKSLSRSSSAVSQKGEVQASIEGRARRIGKSIRPFLTDEDAPRQAMEELGAKSKRAYSKASGKVNDFVSFVLVLDGYDPVNAPPRTQESSVDDISEMPAATTTSSPEATNSEDSTNMVAASSSSSSPTLNTEEGPSTEAESTTKSTVEKEESAPSEQLVEQGPTEE